MKPNRLLFVAIVLLGSVSSLTFPETDSGSDSIAEASVSVGLYLTSMAGKEIGVSQLQHFFQDAEVSKPGKLV